MVVLGILRVLQRDLGYIKNVQLVDDYVIPNNAVRKGCKERDAGEYQA